MDRLEKRLFTLLMTLAVIALLLVMGTAVLAIAYLLRSV